MRNRHVAGGSRPPARRAPVVSIDSGGHRAEVLARRDALVEEHMHLVPPLARRLLGQLPPSFELDDLIAVGNLALVHLATRYRPDFRVPFAAFARLRLRGAMLDSIRGRHYDQATRPSLEAETVGTSQGGATNNRLSTIHEPRDQAADIVMSIDEGRLRQRLREAIRALPARQRAVVATYYADELKQALRRPEFDPRRLNHLACVSAALGLPEWRVIREHADAIAALRRKLGA